jgi:hypothetical protein
MSSINADLVTVVSNNMSSELDNSAKTNRVMNN